MLRNGLMVYWAARPYQYILRNRVRQDRHDLHTGSQKTNNLYKSQLMFRDRNINLKQNVQENDNNQSVVTSANIAKLYPVATYDMYRRYNSSFNNSAGITTSRRRLAYMPAGSPLIIRNGTPIPNVYTEDMLEINNNIKKELMAVDEQTKTQIACKIPAPFSIQSSFMAKFEKRQKNFQFHSMLEHNRGRQKGASALNLLTENKNEQPLLDVKFFKTKEQRNEPSNFMNKKEAVTELSTKRETKIIEAQISEANLQRVQHKQKWFRDNLMAIHTRSKMKNVIVTSGKAPQKPERNAISANNQFKIDPNSRMAKKVQMSGHETKSQIPSKKISDTKGSQVTFTNCYEWTGFSMQRPKNIGAVAKAMKKGSVEDSTIFINIPQAQNINNKIKNIDFCQTAKKLSKDLKLINKESFSSNANDVKPNSGPIAEALKKEKNLQKFKNRGKAKANIDQLTEVSRKDYKTNNKETPSVQVLCLKRSNREPQKRIRRSVNGGGILRTTTADETNTNVANGTATSTRGSLWTNYTTKAATVTTLADTIKYIFVNRTSSAAKKEQLTANAVPNAKQTPGASS